MNNVKYRLSGTSLAAPVRLRLLPLFVVHPADRQRNGTDRGGDNHAA
jgi:hypothetical protein